MDCYGLFKSWDMFGVPVSLKLRDEGTIINTALGGFVSLLIKAALVFYLYTRIIKLIAEESEKEFELENLIE